MMVSGGDDPFTLGTVQRNRILQNLAALTRMFENGDYMIIDHIVDEMDRKELEATFKASITVHGQWLELQKQLIDMGVLIIGNGAEGITSIIVGLREDNGQD